MRTMIKTSTFIFLLFAVLQLFGQKPNIIFIVADDHGKDALGCYGNPVIKTPALDQLAATGTRFDRAFCTTASCSASRSVILTGLHNHANGQYGHEHTYHHFRAFDTIASLPVLLEKGGYRTARIGKYHVGPESVFHFQQAFKVSGRSAVEMAEAVNDFIQPAEQPFFLYFSFDDHHRGGVYEKKLPYATALFGNRLQSYPGIQEIKYDPEQVIVPPFLPNTPETKAEIAQYYQAISRLDQGVGRLLEHLKAAGQFDNTLIVYISDNGMAFPGAKTTLYEAGMQLPCIVKLPGQKVAATTDAMISWVDLTPTLLDAAGLSFPREKFHGQSFLPALKGEKWHQKSVFASHTFHEITMYYPMRVMRGERYKLIYNMASGLEYPFASDLWESKTWQSVVHGNLKKLGAKDVNDFLHRPAFELYDLESDPLETNNLADHPAYAEILKEMKAQIHQFQSDTRDPWVYKWKYE